MNEAAREPAERPGGTRDSAGDPAGRSGGGRDAARAAKSRGGMREAARDPKWRLLVLRQCMGRVSAALVICAAVAGIYGNRVYFSFAACAAGALLLGSAWFSRCRWKDGKAYGEERTRIPEMLRKKGRRRHRPAFLMDSGDFDDDLTRYTSAREEDFSEDQRWRAKVVSGVLAAGMLLLASLI